MAKLYVDDVNVGVKELYAVLGIDPDTIPKKLERIFEINPDRLRKDEFGREKAPRALGISTKFDVYSPLHDKMVTVRYAETERAQTTNGIRTIVYKPAQLYIFGKAAFIKDDIKFAFTYIHPDCNQSPFNKLNGSYRYFFKDNEALAKADLLRDTQEMRAMSMIIGDHALPTGELRKIAKGMNISGVDSLTDAEVKNELKRLAKANPNKFRDDATDNSIQFNGMIQDAIDKSIVTLLSNNGYQRWYFVNEELCVVPAGSDAVQVLKDAIIRKMDLIPQINNAIAGKSVQSELNKPENQKYFKTPVADVTRQEVSPNIKKENAVVNEEFDVKAYIKKLMEAEDKAILEGKEVHHSQRNNLIKYRADIDALRASLQPA